MTAPAFVTAQMVRDYISLEVAATSQYSDATLGSNIRAAANMMEFTTRRWLYGRTAATFTATTNGQASVTIPGLRTATSATVNGSALDVDESYWLVPDPAQTGLYTAIQLRAVGRDWRYSRDWFDRGLDLPGPGDYSSTPNDLVIVGDWGFLAGTEPEEVLHVNKVLAGFLTLRPAALLSGGFSTQQGSSFDLSAFPIEFQAFVSRWQLRRMVAAVGVG